MFANNLSLCRFILRRDRIRILIWMIGLLFLTVGFGNIVPGMYPSDAERLVMAETMKSPAMVSMIGPVYDEGGYTVGALYGNFMLLWTVAIAGIMNIFHIIRHTRQDEERGRIEVIRSLPVGRLSNLSASLSTAVLINVVIAAAIGIGLALLGIESMDINGSLLFGAAVGITGILFAVVTAVFCQLSSSPRTANGLSFAFLGIMFLIRAAGDIKSEALACISPLGLILRIKVYVENLWWPVVIMLLLCIAFSALAFYLCGKRDMGEGLIPARPGKKNASGLLNSAEGLAWRLLRTSFITWTITVLFLGVAYGSIMGDLESFISTNEIFQQIFTSSGTETMTEQFIGFLMVIMAVLNTIPCLSFILKARSQERGGYAENVLSRSISRGNQMMSYFLISVIASVLMPVMTAVGFWSSSYAVMENPIKLSVYLKAIIVYVPAVWLLIGVAMALIAYLPRYASFSWALLGYSFFIVYFGSVMDLPDWMKKLSPYAYIPKIPLEELKLVNIVILVIISTVLAVLGFAGYRSRDMKFS